MGDKPLSLAGGNDGSQPQDLDDAELARRTADGDRDAAQLLILRYQGVVRSFLLKLSRRPAVADDVAQETFLKMLRYADRYDPKYPMKTWLLTIARRTWLNHLRRADNRVKSGEFSYMASNEADPAALVELTDRQERARELLGKALEKLSDPQRTAIVLFHQQQLPIQEIAKVMKMPEGTVKSHLHRARAALREILEPQREVIDQ